MAEWTWRYSVGSGAVVDPAGLRGIESAEFSSKSDAESWLGENWRDLGAAGVDTVTLIEGDRVDYGPMSLHPDT